MYLKINKQTRHPFQYDRLYAPECDYIYLCVGVCVGVCVVRRPSQQDREQQ